jgi:hypothetical protein
VDHDVALPAHRPAPWHQAGHRRRRPLHPGDLWHLLADPTVGFHDLDAGFYDTHSNPERAKRIHVRQLEALGYKVTLEPAAWQAPIDTAWTRLRCATRGAAAAYARWISDQRLRP